MGITMCAEDRKCNFVENVPNSKFGINNKKNKFEGKDIINFKQSLLYVKSDLVRKKERKILNLEKKIEKLRNELNNLNK